MLLNVTPMQIIEKNKNREISVIRILYYKLRYDMHGESFTEIGRETDRYYTTVRRGIERANELLSYDKQTIQMWNSIKSIPGLYLSNAPSKYFASA